MPLGASARAPVSLPAVTRLQRWERATSIPLMLLALLFLVAYGVPIIWPEISPAAHDAAELASWVIWTAFVADFLIRLGVAEKRRLFLRRNWLDIPVIALPLLRPTGCCVWSLSYVSSTDEPPTRCTARS